MAEESLDQMMASLGRSIQRKRRRRAGRSQRFGYWLVSFLAHAFVLYLMGRWTSMMVAEEERLPPIVLKLITDPPKEKVKEAEPPEREKPKKDVETRIDEKALVPESPRKKGPSLDLPKAKKTIEAPERPGPDTNIRATRAFAIEARKRGYSRRIYARRSRSGRSRAVGGPGGTTLRAERSVDGGLLWLAKVQEPSGRWSCTRWGGRDDYDVGVTGLALLAFLSAGHTQNKGRYKDTVGEGLDWLRRHQDKDGRFEWRTFYEQGIATMAITEAFGITRDLRIAHAAQQAINYICATQPEHGGFRYKGATQRSDGDMSVTGWHIMALRSGVCAELEVPMEAISRAQVFLESSYREPGGSAYVVSDSRATPAMTACGMLCRQFIGGYDDEVQAGASYLVRYERAVGGPARGKNRLVGDLYYTYYSVLAMFQFGGEYWTRWNRRFRDALVNAQVRERLDSNQRYVLGSWDPKNHHWGSAGGRVYTTAMALMSLEVYYRFLPIYKK